MSDILKQEVQGIQPINTDSGIVNPQQMDTGAGLKQSMDNVGKVFGELGNSLYKQEMYQKKVEEEALAKQQEANRKAEEKITMFELKDNISRLATGIGLEKEKYYSDPEGYNALIEEGREAQITAINKSNLSDVNKAEAIYLTDEALNSVTNKFHTGYTSYKKTELKERLEDNIGKAEEVIKYDTARGDFSTAHIKMESLLDSLYTRETLDDSWNRKDTHEYLTKFTGDMMLINVHGKVEKIMNKYDTNTISGINGAMKEINALEKSYEGEGYVKATNEIFGYFGMNGDKVKKELKGDIKTLMAEKKKRLDNMKSKVEKVKEINLYQLKNDTAKFYEEETGMTINSFTLANGGARYYLMAKTGKGAKTDSEAIQIAKDNNYRWSLYSHNDMKALKEDFKRSGGKVDYDYIAKEFDKIIGNVGLNEYWSDQLYKDWEEITGGSVDEQKIKSYMKQHRDEMGLLDLTQNFKNMPQKVDIVTDIVQISPDKGFFGSLFNSGKSQNGSYFRDESFERPDLSVTVKGKLEDMLMANAKLEGEFDGKLYEKTVKLINEGVNSLFYKDMTKDELSTIMSMSEEDIYQKQMEYLSTPEGKREAIRVVDNAISIYLEGRTMKRTNRGDVIVVPEYQKDVNINEFETDIQNAEIYDPDTGMRVPDYYYDKFSIGGTVNIDDGMVGKYKDKTLMVMINGKLVPATPSNVKRSIKRNEPVIKQK